MKPALRKSIRQSLSALSQSTIETQSAQITKHVLAHPAYNAATRVSIYISKDNAPEVSTIALIRHTLSAGKQCFIPRWCVDLVIMPLLAFDTEGWRLGHGGGYYDRFLAECEKVWGNEQSGNVIRTIAIALKEQLVEGSVPRDEYDKKPDVIIVADGEFSCRN
ncbi:nagb/rpia/CoA transferase-like protein [Rhizoclosmatium globosum]|uniref:5-formyltetrahydrofolate cyclo-ligase n=1 Tax=Rhizoclosmatium globosum TaxID=329046 RepID=A0A1Y2D1P5_9FUNG|nr:nagb/rpia/CoA transferase-like protein [Rhizoclosmatium globosum]|eukprot:ORY53127.1 nagb/rpia/CoA transferase-like protein [Rhizoclosmatium globosum]